MRLQMVNPSGYLFYRVQLRCKLRGKTVYIEYSERIANELNCYQGSIFLQEESGMLIGISPTIQIEDPDIDLQRFRLLRNTISLRWTSRANLENLDEQNAVGKLD